MTAVGVEFHDLGSVADEQIKYAVVMAQEAGKWLICRHRKRTTWEIPGGHREAGETIEIGRASCRERVLFLV